LLLAPDSKVVLMVGRVNGWKGHTEFASAARLLHESGLDARFRLLGGPVPGREGLYEALSRLVHDWDPDGTWLAFPGHTADVRAEMSRAAIVVLPSTTATGIAEGFNITALEAMALGRPVVASAVGGLPEVVIDGETGLLVAPGDVDSLASAVRRLVEDPVLARTLGEAGRIRAAEAFTVGSFRASWREVYRKVLGDVIS
jgi:glycosyltransferase involved in cell wall biosynthesis